MLGIGSIRHSGSGTGQHGRHIRLCRALAAGVEPSGRAIVHPVEVLLVTLVPAH
jgi:hypothetical protein